MNLHHDRRDAQPGRPEVIACRDLEIIKLQLEFMHAHGHLPGKVTVLSHTFFRSDSARDANGWTGALIK